MAQLNLSLYGTRDAAKNWTCEYSRALSELGFVVGKASPCNFWHQQRDMHLTVHGDDFTVSGPEQHLKWLAENFALRWEVKTAILGPDAHHVQETKVLNRRLRWTAAGIEHEADIRHRQVILEQLGLLDGTTKPVTTPRGPQEPWSLEDEGALLDGTEATLFRALVARMNYLAPDRPDIQYVVKEAAKRMGKPRRPDWSLLKRIGRYLLGHPRAVQLLEWQERPSGLSTYVDSDWAGDKETCKSTSGGMVFRGSHLLKSWSTNQQVIALSSGEAELYAQIKGAAQTLGMISMAADFGESLSAIVYSDSVAALGICTRVGLGKVRHIKVQYLWLQERITEGDLAVRKVAREANPADLLTKGLGALQEAS